MKRRIGPTRSGRHCRGSIARSWSCRAPAAPPAQRPVAWTLTAAQCPNLPTGTTVTGTGRLREVQGGRVSIEHATGTATDQAGNVYSWSYSFRAVCRSRDSELWVDHFVWPVPDPLCSTTASSPWSVRTG